MPIMFGPLIDIIDRLIRRALSRLGIRSVGLRVTPTAGPNGTTISIRVRGALANDPVTLTIGPGSTGLVADANGELLITDRIMGFPIGSTVPITVIVGTGGAGDQTRRANFRATD